MVVVVKEKDRVLLGVTIADISRYISKNDLINEENLPYFKVRGEDCFVCYAGGGLEIEMDVLKYNDKIFRNITDGNSILQNVIPKLKEIIEPYMGINADGVMKDCVYIIKGNRVFLITRNFIVHEIENFNCVGNDDVVSGIMETIPSLSGEEKLLTVAREVYDLCGIRSFPFIIFDAKTKKRKVFYN
jgi:hypothetical protein